MDERRWLTEREERAWRGLQLMQMRLEGELARQLAAESGLSYPDYLVLVALTDRPDGRMRLFELAAVLGWEKSRLSHHIARMADRGLVGKERCASDRRGAFVVVTKRGRKEIEAAAPGHVAAVRRLFIDRLKPQELDTIADIADVVLGAFAVGPSNALAGCGGGRAAWAEEHEDGPTVSERADPQNEHCPVSSHSTSRTAG